MTLQDWLDNKYTKQKQQKLTHLDCSNTALTDLKGIENLTNLTYLRCYNTALTSLEGIEHLTNLIYLLCYNNQIKSLDLSYNKKLKRVHVDRTVKLLNLNNYNINKLTII